MDPKHTIYSDFTKDPSLHEQAPLPNPDHYLNLENRLEYDIPSPDMSFMALPLDPPVSNPGNFGPSFTMWSEGELFVMPSSGFSPDGGSFDVPTGFSAEGEASSPSDDSDSSDPVLKYISQMLMEENMDYEASEASIFHDPVALKATEKSLSDVLGEQPLSSIPPAPYINHESPSSSSMSGSSSDYGGNTSSSISTSTFASDFVDHQWLGDVGDLHPSLLQTSPPGQQLSLPVEHRSNLEFSANPMDGSDRFGSSSVNEMLQNMFSDKESVLQFNRGLEEASKFLPSPNQLFIDLESTKYIANQNDEASRLVVKEEKKERDSSSNESRGRKNHDREDSELEGRSNKQSAIHEEESELSEMFDKVLLLPKCYSMCSGGDARPDGAAKTLQPNVQSNASSGGKTRARRQEKKTETVDLRSLLILCAQAVSTNDFMTANALLKQIREHSSPTGDGCQRLAHCFANGLEARLAGSNSGSQSLFTSLRSRRITAADILVAYRSYLHASPFKKLSIVFANKMIMHAAEKASTLHIIDFGVHYGFQWPVLIQLLGERPGGAPKLRITGIDLPQRGFRPAERVEETGRRLARYCERFNVPFEYNPVAAQNWESIPIEDLKIRKDEVLAVNCLGQFKNLLDETDEVNCPRNAVLELIRKMNPNIFVHTIINGSYNTPFFLTRFREALFHFSSVFDMFDATMSRDDPGRSMLEAELYGREALNLVGCEGLERVERPETYKQWHGRTTRAGLKTLPLNRELMLKLRDKLRHYHKDFVLDEDCDWVLQGWKGRIVYASSCWVPA